MKINELAIEEYGPLKNTGVIKLGAFNLFYGSNEKGKTLLIDAIIKFLLGKRAKDFNADRVDSLPAGYLSVAAGENNEERILPRDGDLPKITKNMAVPLTATDCRNIFIIRNSDLAISNADGKFYAGMAERLSGLRSTDIRKIKKNLLDIAKLTPNYSFKDDESSQRLKSRLEKAQGSKEDPGLIASLEKAKKHLIDINYDKMELSCYQKKMILPQMSEQLALMEQARARIRYEKSSALLAEADSLIAGIKQLQQFNEDELQSWLDSEREAAARQNDINELKDKTAAINKDIAAIEAGIRNARAALAGLQRTKEKIDNEKINLKIVKDKIAAMQADALFVRILKKSSVISAVIMLALLAVWAMTRANWLLYAGAVPAVLTVILLAYELSIGAKHRKIISETERLRLSLSQYGIKGNSIEDISAQIHIFDENFETERIKLTSLEGDLKLKQKERAETEEKISVYKNTIERAREKMLPALKKAASADEYKESLSRKTVLEKNLGNVASKLAGMLELTGPDDMAALRANVASLEQYRNKAADVEYDAAEYEKLKEQTKELSAQVKDLEEKLENLDARLRDREREVNEVLHDDEPVYCRTLVDIEEILKRLHTFVNENSERKNDIVDTISILEDIELSEKERVHSLFDDSAISVSETFSAISGIESKVIYDRAGDSIKVKRGTAAAGIDPDKLSGGAYDQLYLAVRISLGERLLGSEKGFFILDDPFLKSDSKRLERQMQTLKKICDIGWQIIYFSCKEEIKDLLSADVKKGKVNFLQVDLVDASFFG